VVADRAGVGERDPGAGLLLLVTLSRVGVDGRLVFGLLAPGLVTPTLVSLNPVTLQLVLLRMVSLRLGPRLRGA
jgi:hypothetical protein